jgi:hypothetical protein
LVSLQWRPQRAALLYKQEIGFRFGDCSSMRQANALGSLQIVASMKFSTRSGRWRSGWQILPKEYISASSPHFLHRRATNVSHQSRETASAVRMHVPLLPAVLVSILKKSHSKKCKPIRCQPLTFPSEAPELRTEQALSYGKSWMWYATCASIEQILPERHLLVINVCRCESL